MNTKKIMGYTGVFTFILVAFIVTKVIFNQLWKATTNLSKNFTLIDFNNEFLPDLLFKVIIFIVAILLLYVLKRINIKSKLDKWNMQLPIFRSSKVSLLKVFMVFFVLEFIVEVIGAFIAKSSGVTALNVPDKPYAFIGYFIATTVVNPIAEEMYFRVLMTTLVIWMFKNIFENKRELFYISMLSTTAVFSLAHIGIQVFPFEINHLNIPQLISVTLQGCFYYWLYVKNESVVAPIIAHGIADALYCFSTLIIVFLL